MGLFDWSGRGQGEPGPWRVWTALLGGGVAPPIPPPATGPWYVDSVAGSDSNSGLTSLLPFATLAKIAAVAGDNQFVNLKTSGLFAEAHTTPGVTMTYQGYGTQTTTSNWRNRPRITGLTVAATWSGTSPTDAYDKTGVGTKPSSVIYTTVAGVVTPLQQNTVSKASLVSGQWFHTGTTLTICMAGGNPDSISAIIKINGVTQTGAGLVVVTQGTTFSGIEFEGAYNMGTIATGNTGVSYTDCAWRYNGTSPSAGACRWETGSDGGIVQDSIFQDNCTDSLFSNNCVNLIIRRNIFQRVYGSISDHMQLDGTTGNYSDGASITFNYYQWDAATDSVKGCVIVGTLGAGNAYLFTDNVTSGAGAWNLLLGASTSTGGGSSQVLRNVCVDQAMNIASAAGGFAFGGTASNLLIAYNVAVGSFLSNDSGIRFANALTRTGELVYQNSVYLNAGALSGFRADGTFSGTVENNLFWNPSAVSSVMTVAIPATLTVDYNLIGPEQANYVRYNGVLYATLAAYQLGASQDAHSTSATPVFTAGNQSASAGPTATPVTTTWASVIPAKGSPQVAAGIRVVGVNDTLRNPPDIGAFQSISNSVGATLARGYSMIQKLTRGRV